MRLDSFGALRTNVLGNRAGSALFTITPKHVAQTGLALLLSPGIHPVAEGAAAALGSRNGPDLNLVISGNHAGENLKAGAGKMLGHILHLDGVAQVGLVGTIPARGISEGDHREFRRDGKPAAEFLEHAAQHRFHCIEHVLLGDKAHLDIKLVEFAWAAVGTRVFIAEARSYLEITVKARHHEELLELLRGLRQGIEFSGMDATWHEIVARPFRRRGGEDRRLEFEEALLLHAAAQ